MNDLIREAEEAMAALRYCSNHELCDGCPFERKCLDTNGDFTITQGAIEIIEKLLKKLKNIDN